jgi:hypothetical protein
MALVERMAWLKDGEDDEKFGVNVGGRGKRERMTGE